MTLRVFQAFSNRELEGNREHMTLSPTLLRHSKGTFCFRVGNSQLSDIPMLTSCLNILKDVLGLVEDIYLFFDS